LYSSMYVGELWMLDLDLGARAVWDGQVVGEKGKIINVGHGWLAAG